jgi:hypothetical protein
MEDQASQLRQRMNRTITHFVTRVKGRVIEIADTRTGRVTEVPSLAYRRERQALGEYFTAVRDARVFAADGSCARSRSPNCCWTWWP